MEIKFLGSGGGLVSPDVNYHSNMVVTFDNGYKLLIDAGTHIQFSLAEAGIKPEDIDGIAITHQHADHVGGLEWLAFYNKFMVNRDEKLHLFYGERRAGGYPSEALSELWETTLKGGLEILNKSKVTIKEYFDIYKSLGGVRFIPNNHLEYTTKVNTHNKLAQDIKSYAFSFSLLLENVFISGDAKYPTEQMLNIMQQVDTVFYDCEFANYEGSVHAQYHELKQLPDDIKSKMYLYHHNLTNKDIDDAMNTFVKEAGFAGIVKKGDTFTV